MNPGSDCRSSTSSEKQNEGRIDTLEEYVEEAMPFVIEQKVKKEAEALSSSRAPVEDDDDHLPSQQRDDISSSQGHGQLKKSELDLIDKIFKKRELDLINKILHGEAYKLFVDLSSPYPLRLSIFKSFWVLSEERAEKAYAYGSVRQGLASAFISLYTKLKISGDLVTGTADVARSSLFWREKKIRFGEAIKHFIRNLVQFPCLYLPWAAIGLFHKSDKEGYSGIDVKITYAVFCCTAVLELFSPSIFEAWEDNKEQWPEMVAQYNLAEYFVRNKNHSNIMCIASRFWCKDFLDQHWSMKSCFSSGTIVTLVLKYLKDGWRDKIHDSVSYHKFNDNRGQWALERYYKSAATSSSTLKQKSVEGYEDELGLGRSIKGAFDKSVLLWHIATDFCFFLKNRPDKADQCRQMSNYMVYLLFVNPEMLLPGTRRHLFTTAYDELKDILGDNKLNPQSCCCCCEEVVEDELMKALIKKMENKSENQDLEIGSQEKSKERQPKGGSQENFIDNAWDLAQRLLKMDDDKMWDLIQGVWVEMLCFSAGRCRGYLHAKALGSGGEFLSYIWLLMFYMGMETFRERLQREDLPSRKANNNAASSSSMGF